MDREEWNRVKGYTHRKPIDLLGERVKIHWHQHQKMYSVSVYVPKKGWRAIYNPDLLDVTKMYDPATEGYQQFLGKLLLKNVEFKVSPSGKERAREERKRNVHAWLIGELITFDVPPAQVIVPCAEPVWYSAFAYEEDCFKTVNDNEDIYNADMAALGIMGEPRKPQILAIR